MKKIVGLIVLILVLLCVTGAMAGSSNNWCWPTVSQKVNCGWGYYSSGKAHSGIDYYAEVGTDVYSTCDGVVLSVINSGTKNYGLHIIIEASVNNDIVYIYYGHLSDTFVSEGDKVVAGQLIGLSGESGNVTGPHLHYEVRNSDNHWYRWENGLGPEGCETINPNPNYLPGSTYFFSTWDDLTADITSVTCEGRDNSGFMIRVEVDNDSAISEVKLYCRDNINGNNPATCLTMDWMEKNVYKKYVSYSLFPSSATVFYNHPYVISSSGEQSEGVIIGVTKKGTLPSITSAKIIGADADGYMVECKIRDQYLVKGATIATWTNGGGDTAEAVWKPMVRTDNNTFKYYVHFSDHRSNSTVYYNDIYVDTQVPDEQVKYSLLTYTKTPPTISNIEVPESSITKTSFSAKAKVTDNVSLSRVEIGVWAQSKGGGAATWYEMKNIGNNIWQYTLPRGTNEQNYFAQIRAYNLYGQRTDSKFFWHGNLVVTFDYNDNGSVLTSKEIAAAWYDTNTAFKSYGAIPEPSRSGFRFDGWFTADGKQITNSSKVTLKTDHTLTAHWTDIESPVVSNENLTDVSATFATFSVTATDNVAVDHVNVKVWHGDYEANMPNAEVYPAIKTGDVWSATVPLELNDGDSWYMYAVVYDAAGNHTDSGLGGLKQFTLSFDAGEGAACDEQFRTMIYTSLTQNGVRSYLTTYGELPEASLAGHSLDGWFFENGEPVTPETLVTNKEDHTLYAHWTLADDEIPVVSNGVLSNITEDSATVTVTAADNTEVERVTVEVHPGLWKGKNPTVFDARKVEDVWVCDFTFDFDESDMQRFFVDAYDVAGNKSYSTTFSSDVFGYFVKATVTYDANGGACDTAEAEKITACIDNRVEGGTSYPNLMGEMPEPVLENNTFLGWFDQTGCVITMNSPVMFSQDTILTAHWLKDYTKGKATIGTNGSLITVSYIDPCIISESDDGVAYRRVIPSQGEQGYTFQTSKSQVAVVIAGDIDLNAIVNGNDYISLKSYKSTPLEGVNAAAGDLNNDAKIDLLDVALYRRSNITDSSHPAYQPLSWYPLSPVYENTLILPEALTTIENEAFRGIEGVNIVVPNTVTDIAERAFGSYVLIICPDDSYAAEFAEDESIPHMESL